MGPAIKREWDPSLAAEARGAFGSEVSIAAGSVASSHSSNIVRTVPLGGVGRADAPANPQRVSPTRPTVHDVRYIALARASGSGATDKLGAIDGGSMASGHGSSGGSIVSLDTLDACLPPRVPRAFLCPILGTVMRDPVCEVSASGLSYERVALERKLAAEEGECGCDGRTPATESSALLLPSMPP